MGRKLDLGEHGEFVCTPQTKIDGKWRTAPHVRSAQRWRARVYFVGNDGIRGSVEGFGAKKQSAESSCNAKLEERLHAGDELLKASTPLVLAGRTWLEQISRPGSGKSDKTVSDYSECFGRHIDVDGSPIRGLNLKQVNDPQRLSRYLQDLADRRGSGSAKMARSVLSGIFGYAVKMGVLPTNAMRQVGAVRSRNPTPTTRDRSRAMTKAERDRVVAFADAQVADAAELNPRTLRKRQTTADFVAFLAGTGVRIAEARSLLWEDVDLIGKRVRVRGTKSTSADRVVSLPEWLNERLFTRSRNVGTDGFVFPAPSALGNERPWDQSNNNEAVRSVIDGAGFAWAIPHTFRRTVASLLHQAGVPLARIADQLGHSDPSMTASVYLGRSFDDDKSDLAAHL